MAFLDPPQIFVAVIITLEFFVLGGVTGRFARKIVRRMDRDRESIRKQARLAIEKTEKLDRKLVGLGARWGELSENAFREGMAGILTEFGFSVEKFREMDADAKVFRLPSLVEVDVVVRNGKTILVEIKSSITHRDVFIFDQISKFYESRVNREADYKAIISPYSDDRAKDVAKELGIRLYTDSTEFATQEPDSGEAND